MPHQCLNCGETFADGSTDLLKGCPSCEGTRFFFTDEPLDADERAELEQETSKDVHSMLEDLLAKGEKRNLGEDIWSREAWERWIRLEAGEDGPTLKEVSQSEVVFEQDPEGAPADPADDGDEPATKTPKPMQVQLDEIEEVEPPEPDPPSPEQDAPADPAAQIVDEAPGPASARPSTLNIVEPGNYEIDVERLMEDNPVIVERDGSYVIHLPSVFGAKRER